ncbi:MAG: hypothetical protein L0G23_03610 [Ruaniaceae bacterium]|nr:hypothetical protein [Ruaniaceae bacterium]
MSTLPRTVVAAPLPRPRTRPRLEVVRAPETSRSVVPFLVGCVLVLLAALVAALILNTSMAVASYSIHAGKSELAVLTEIGDQLAEKSESLASPSQLQNRAAALGMVPAEATLYLSVATGSILGTAEEGN